MKIDKSTPRRHVETKQTWIRLCWKSKVWLQKTEKPPKWNWVMNPRPMAGQGFGAGWMPGTKHLFGEQSGSSAVCLRQLFPQHPIFPPTWSSCSDWLRVRHAVTSSTPGRDGSGGDIWSLEGESGSEDRRGGDARAVLFYLPRPLPSSCKWTSKPSVAEGTSAGRDGKRRQKRPEKWNASFQFTRPYT